MQRPFNIFPSDAYKNTQFQVLATKEIENELNNTFKNIVKK
jgi:hypothetical protein